MKDYWFICQHECDVCPMVIDCPEYRCEQQAELELELGDNNE